MLDDLLEKMEESSHPVDIICLAIFNDLHGRKGFRHTIDGCDDDIIVEMIHGWHDIVSDRLGL